MSSKIKLPLAIGIGFSLVLIYFIWNVFSTRHNFVYYHVPSFFLEGAEDRSVSNRQFVPMRQLSKSDIRPQDLVAFKNASFAETQFARIISVFGGDVYDAVILNNDGSTSTGKINFEWIVGRD